MNGILKSGDLVKHKSVWHDHGVGLVIRKTGKIDTWGMRHDEDEHMRWWVHWTTPPHLPEPNGYFITYEVDVIIINAA
jgi:hypothetical protein